MDTNNEPTELELAFQVDEREAKEFVKAIRLAGFQRFKLSPHAAVKLSGTRPVETGQLSTRQPRPRKPAPRGRAALVARQKKARP